MPGMYPQQQQQTIPSFQHLPSNTYSNNINLGNQLQPPQQNNTFGKSPNEKEFYLQQLKSKYHDQAAAIAKKLQSDLNPQRENMVVLQNLHLKITDEEAKLTKYEHDARIVVQELEERHKMLDQMLASNEKYVLSAESIEQCLEQDQNSKLMLDLLSINRAIEDVNIFMENELKSNRIDIDTYMKKLKENTEREFINKVLSNRTTAGVNVA